MVPCGAQTIETCQRHLCQFFFVLLNLRLFDLAACHTSQFFCPVCNSVVCTL